MLQKNMTSKEQNDLVKKYEPLINKMISQFYGSVNCSWNDLKSMAYEGFAIAIKKYDSKRSGQTFTQFAAYAMYHNILSSLDEELRTVKLSAYAQKKVTEAGGTLFNSVSIDQPYSGDEEMTPREIVMGMYENEKFSNGDVFEYLYKRIDNEFEEIDREIFYRTFGLHGYEETSGKKLAQHFGLSEGRISQRLKKVVEFIKHDKDLCEVLSTLLEGAK